MKLGIFFNWGAVRLTDRKWRVNEGCAASCRLPSISAEFLTARGLSSWEDLLVPVDHLIDDHSAVDTTPSLKVRGRTSVSDEAIVTDCEPVASLAIHHSSPDHVPHIRGAVCEIPGSAA